MTFQMNVQEMAEFVVKEYGRLDYAVNAAGLSRFALEVP